MPGAQRIYDEEGNIVGGENEPLNVEGSITIEGELPAGTQEIGGVQINGIVMPSTGRNGKATANSNGSATALGGSATLLNGVIVKAGKGNTQMIYVGFTGLTTENGLELEAGEETFFVIDDIAKVFCCVDNGQSGQYVTYQGS